MKAKYEKMIDEYVKKHYGDLERGVLAPEVKYKVLFKLYRKKYKEKKIQVRTLRRLLQGKKEIETWDEEELPCSGCEHYVPMHPEGLSVIPASCSIGKSMTACCPFYSVKVDEKKAQKEMQERKKDSYLDWLHDDITWCCRECSDMSCERNTMNRKMTTGFISMADMYDPFRCPVDAAIEEKK